MANGENGNGPAVVDLEQGHVPGRPERDHQLPQKRAVRGGLAEAEGRQLEAADRILDRFERCFGGLPIAIIALQNEFVEPYNVSFGALGEADLNVTGESS